MNYTITIETGSDARLLVREHETGQGRRYAAIAPQFCQRGLWRLAHSGLILSPDAARELVPALLAIAARIDASPGDPMPDDGQSELSRMPGDSRSDSQTARRPRSHASSGGSGGMAAPLYSGSRLTDGRLRGSEAFTGQKAHLRVPASLREKERRHA